MASPMRASVVVDLVGNMSERARQFGRSIKDMSDSGSRSLRLLQLGAQQTGRALDGMANRYTAFATGGTMALGIRNVVEMDRSIRALGVASGNSAEQMEEIKQQLLATAQQSNIRIEYKELETAIGNIVELTGDLDFALANREVTAMTISATGASGQAVGGFMAEMQKMGLTAQEVQASIAQMIAQGKEGAFTMQDLASLGPRVVSAYATSGRTGPQALQEMGAMLQMIRMSAGSSEQAATTFEALMRNFNNNKVLKSLQKRGIQVFDPEKLKQGEKVLRPINELVTEIIEKTKGDTSKIAQVFTDSEALRAFNTGIAEYKRLGKVESLDRFMSVDADPQALVEDSQRMADSYAALLNNLNTAWMEFSTNNLSGPVEELAKTLRSLSQEDVQRWMEIGKNIVYVGAAAIAARKAWQAGTAIKRGVDALRGRGAGAGAGSGGAGGVGGRGGLGGIRGAIPVYIVDGPMSLLPDRSPDAPDKRRNGGRRGGRRVPMPGAGGPATPTFGGAPKVGTIARVGAPLAVIGGAVDAGMVLMSDAPVDEKVTGVSSAVGGAGGAWAGAVAGAAIGSAVPLIGTAIGGILGGALGYYLGDFLGEKTGEAINSTLDLKVKVEGPPGTTARVENISATGTDLDAQVYSGFSMPPLL